MKVLWFTNTPSLYDKGTHHYNGAGWIEALEQLISERTDLQLGISFFHPADGQKERSGKVTYYPILRRKKGPLKRLFHNWSRGIEESSFIASFLKVIEDFKPDVIHVFGTEGPFARIQEHIEIPVVIHLQGLINPSINAFFPPGIGGYEIFLYPPFFIKHLMGNSLHFDIKRLKKQGKRELEHFKAAKYLMGRTEWDKSIAELLAPQARYFHVDEVLRPSFYESAGWRAGNSDKLVIVSTISNTMYKGLDVILKTANLLRQSGKPAFEWQVIGLEEQNIIVGFHESFTGIRFRDCGVNFRGKFSGEELVECLNHADVFVHPSHIDNSPNSVCEAQMLGIPVIACNVGGVPTLVDHDVTGILVPANGTYEIVNQLKKLAADKSRGTRLGTQARLAAMKRHNKERILSDILKVYETIRIK